MTAQAHDARLVSTSATTLPQTDLTDWNRELNRTHAMAAMRARAGRVVNGIEARRRRLVVDRVLRHAPRAVVDVGCEDGWIAEGYVDQIGALTLVDLDTDVLAGSTLAANTHVRMLTADATDASALRAGLGHDAADMIVLSALLEHLPRPETALHALAPVLRSGGRFVIYLPADGPILFAKAVLKHSRLGSLIRGLSLEPAPGHLHRFTRRHVARLVRPFGEVEELTFDPVCLGYLCAVRKR